jgi:hypothetical protein
MTSPATKLLGEVAMFRRTVTTLVLASAIFAPVASHAFPFFANVNAATQPKAKMVKVTLKNETNAPMQVLIEDKPVTIAANGEYALNAPEGTHVYGTDKSVKLVVTRDVNVASFR